MSVLNKCLQAQFGKQTPHTNKENCSPCNKEKLLHHRNAQNISWKSEHRGAVTPRPWQDSSYKFHILSNMIYILSRHDSRWFFWHEHRDVAPNDTPASSRQFVAAAAALAAAALRQLYTRPPVTGADEPPPWRCSLAGDGSRHTSTLEIISRRRHKATQIIKKVRR